jgi:hypothetical protein
MKYTVVWSPRAEDALAEIWVRASNRQAIAAAANFIDRTLQRSPHTKGQDLYGDRLIVQPPLSVVYSV